MTTKLSEATLSEIGEKVSKPCYDRADLSAGILHIGVGNFHRAHQAIYLHELFNLGIDLNWAIVGAGVMPSDGLMRDRLESQNWLSTIVELDPEGFSATVCGSMIDFVAVDVQKLIDAMAEPSIRIVSLTVTEGGYFVDAKTEGFDSKHPDIVTDRRNYESPKTVFGIIVAALVKRRQAGTPAFTVMSCDNLPGNGHVAKQAVLGIASARSDDTHDWIEKNVAFPNSMVDRITPATSDRERTLVRDTFGIDDSAPVVCEPFKQWVLEDNFPNGRPALEKVGVQFVEDVVSYELLKLRVLNGGHAAIAYPAGLLDIHFVHDAMLDPLISAYLDKLEQEEIIPTAPQIPDVSNQAYYKNVAERFSNKAIGDTIPRLCFDGLNRQPKFILPVIEARLHRNQSIDGLALVSALWCRYCFGTTDSGEHIPPNDPAWERLTEKAKLAKDEPTSWLAMTDVYGSLSTNAVFRDAFSNALLSLWRDGITATLATYIE